MQGVDLEPGGPARRKSAKTPELDEDVVKAIRQRASLRAISEAPATALTDPNKLLAQIGTMTQDMPPDLAAAAMHGAASQYVRIGQWDLAREAYQLLIDRYPTHPLSIDAYRWLVRQNASGEARRRHELGQFLALSVQQGTIKPDGQSIKLPATDDKTAPREIKMPKTEMHKESAEFSLLSSKADLCKRYQACLDLDKQLVAFGPIASNDPTIQFPVQAAKRNLGLLKSDPNLLDEAQEWYKQFASRQPNGPWRDAALAELWLSQHKGAPPKPLAVCCFTDTKPYLDGKLDDACWQAGQALRLHDAGPAPKAAPGKQPETSDLDKKFQTEVRLAYDREFLYLAVHCTHPEGRQTPLMKKRTHDADLRGYDRVSLLLDLDRDYSTCYHLQVDQRGCVCDDCWGDKTWDPRWFVAVQSDATSWTVEAAIPLLALTDEPPTNGHAWAFNAVRVIPGRGVQSFSQPAEAPEETMRLEGMGLLMFMEEMPTTPMPAPH
jgi:tetratricopeptide (TPR) repeat protein